MKKLLTLIFVLSLFGCASEQTEMISASTGNKIRKNASDGAPLADDYSWVDGLDFKTVEEKKFQSDKDIFKGETSEADALSKESIARLSKPKLEEVALSSSDPLDKIASLCYQEQFDSAFKLVDEIYAGYKNNTSYWNQVGTCYFLKGEYSKSILFFNKSRDLDASYLPPINNLGVVYQTQGKFQKALAAYKKASDLNTFALTPLYNLSQLYLKFGKIDKAFSILEALNKKKPGDNDVAGSLATGYLMKGNMQKAVELFTKIPKTELADARFGLNFALALKLSDRQSDAVLVLNNVIEPTMADLKNYYQRVNEFIRK